MFPVFPPQMRKWWQMMSLHAIFSVSSSCSVKVTITVSSSTKYIIFGKGTFPNFFYFKLRFVRTNYGICRNSVKNVNLFVYFQISRTTWGLRQAAPPPSMSLSALWITCCDCRSLCSFYLTRNLHWPEGPAWTGVTLIPTTLLLCYSSYNHRYIWANMTWYCSSKLTVSPSFLYAGVNQWLLLVLLRKRHYWWAW